MSEQMLTEEQIITIKKAAIATDPGKPWGDSIAFARAIESAVRAEYAHIRREARNAALEEAAERAFDYITLWAPLQHSKDFADSIRALKDQP